MLVINDERFIRRAEIIWEKGTNRAEFFRGEVNKYGWEIPEETLKFTYYACDDDSTNQAEEDERLAQVDKVLKEETPQGTRSHMTELTEEQRVSEIAQMLSGSDITEAALANAQELLRSYRK